MIRLFFSHAFDGPSDYAMNLPAGRTYKKSDLVALGAGQKSSLVVHQTGFFRAPDETDKQYFDRAFIWGTVQFQLSDDIRFVVNADGSREITNYGIYLPGGKDKFTFDGGLYQI